MMVWDNEINEIMDSDNENSSKSLEKASDEKPAWGSEVSDIMDDKVVPKLGASRKDTARMHHKPKENIPKNNELIIHAYPKFISFQNCCTRSVRGLFQGNGDHSRSYLPTTGGACEREAPL